MHGEERCLKKLKEWKGPGQKSSVTPRIECGGGFLWMPYVPQRNDGTIDWLSSCFVHTVYHRLLFFQQGASIFPVALHRYFTHNTPAVLIPTHLFWHPSAEYCLEPKIFTNGCFHKFIAYCNLYLFVAFSPFFFILLIWTSCTNFVDSAGHTYAYSEVSQLTAGTSGGNYIAQISVTRFMILKHL